MDHYGQSLTSFSLLVFFFIADRVAVIVFGIITLIAGVILSSVPWLNYFILKVKRLAWCDATKLLD